LKYNLTANANKNNLLNIAIYDQNMNRQATRDYYKIDSVKEI